MITLSPLPIHSITHSITQSLNHSINHSPLSFYHHPLVKNLHNTTHSHLPYISIYHLCIELNTPLCFLHHALLTAYCIAILPHYTHLLHNQPNLAHAAFSRLHSIIHALFECYTVPYMCVLLQQLGLLVQCTGTSQAPWRALAVSKLTQPLGCLAKALCWQCTRLHGHSSKVCAAYYVFALCAIGNVQYTCLGAVSHYAVTINQTRSVLTFT